MLKTRQGTLKSGHMKEMDSFNRNTIFTKSIEEKQNNKLKVAEMENELLDDDGIVANCVMFFLGGYESMHSLLLFCSYVMAIHQDVQEKVRAEVNSILASGNTELSYEDLDKLSYMGMFVNGKATEIIRINSLSNPI